jgi:hypothetical protein
MHPPSSRLQAESFKGFGSNPHEVQTLSSQDGAPSFSSSQVSSEEMSLQMHFSLLLASSSQP